jgi:hypothetical protein
MVRLQFAMPYRHEGRVMITSVIPTRMRFSGPSGVHRKAAYNSRGMQWDMKMMRSSSRNRSEHRRYKCGLHALGSMRYFRMSPAVLCVSLNSTRELTRRATYRSVEEGIYLCFSRI